MTDALRCPFCHDQIAADAPLASRLACAECGAIHHTECLVEADRCSGTGCGARAVQVGSTVLALDALADLSPEDLEALARRKPLISGEAASLLLPLVASGAIFGFYLTGVPSPLSAPLLFLAGVLGGAASGLVAWLFVRSLLRKPSRLTLGRVGQTEEGMLRTESFDPITGLWGKGGALGDLSSPYAATMDRIQEDAAPEEVRALRRSARPLGTPPGACPFCTQPLDLADAEPEAAWFCYHCGGELVDMGGQYLDPDAIQPPEKEPPRKRDRA